MRKRHPKGKEEGPIIPNRLRALSPGQAEYLRAMRESEITLALGPAGTGRTYMAAGLAAQMLAEGRVKRIILSRPLVECGERMGFLPGDVTEKLSPYVLPLLDSLADFMSLKEIDKCVEDGQIEFCPLGVVRGRTFRHAFAILDESQNASLMQLKAFLTRLGEGTKMVLNGDASQSDLPGRKCDFENVCSKLDGLKGVSVVKLGAEDIQRHPLVGEIIKRL